MVPAELYTERLRLRRWQHSDSRPFAELNADPAVMEYYPAPLTRAESAAMVARIEATFDVRGFGLWAVEVRASGALIGYVGLSPATFDAHFTPAGELGMTHDAADDFDHPALPEGHRLRHHVLYRLADHGPRPGVDVVARP